RKKTRSVYPKNCGRLFPRLPSNTITAVCRTQNTGCRWMNKPARIAVDAMGGDHAPEEVVAGALAAAEESDAEIVLVGDETRVNSLLGGVKPRVCVVHAPESVPMAQSPSAALRGADRTSLGIAVELVK